MNLERFHQAQTNPTAGWAVALAEMRAGHKRSHWIWYIFPQLDGLGRSSTARAYALRDMNEAADYLRDPVLGARYGEIVSVVGEQLAGGVAIEDLMGGSTDAAKLVSSLTLFRAAASQLAAGGQPEFNAVAKACDAILQRTATQGYPACAYTLQRCATSFGAGTSPGTAAD